MSSPPWDTIPLLALKCIIEHLEEKDALAATSTCRHWRSSMLMYEGQRDLLRLPVLDLEKSDFLVRIFRKHTQRLHIQIDVEATEQLNTFMCYILPQFLDSINLQEIVFIGPLYINLNRMMQFAQLRRVITETLLYKHAHVLESFAVIGCEMSVVDENDRLLNSQLEHYSKPLSFLLEQPFAESLSENTILSKNNVNMMMFSNLKHIVFEYDLISTEALITLSKLENFKMLSLNFLSKKGFTLPRIDWGAVTPLFSKGLEVAVNLIYLSENRLKQVLDNVLCEEMPVTSVKALFLRNFYMTLIVHVTRLYGSTLEEFIWADPPTPFESCNRSIPADYSEVVQSPYSHVNPFIYLSWQCHNLEKLVVHGYWICEYDLLGITRLRPGIDLVVSSIYDSTSYLFEHPPTIGGGNLMRVMSTDGPPRVTPVNKSVLKYVYYSKRGRSSHNRESPRVKPVNKNWVVSRKIYMSRLNELQTKQLTPKNWQDLPDGLKLGATRAQRTEYIVSAVLEPLGIT